MDARSEGDETARTFPLERALVFGQAKLDVALGGSGHAMRDTVVFTKRRLHEGRCITDDESRRVDVVLLARSRLLENPLSYEVPQASNVKCCYPLASRSALRGFDDGPRAGSIADSGTIRAPIV